MAKRKRNNSGPRVAGGLKKTHPAKRKVAINRLRWFVIRTQSGKEVKAAVHIAKLGVQVFVPMFYEMQERIEGKGKWMVPVERGPLFPRYIFVAVRQQSPLWGAIAEADGVERVICSKHTDVRPATPIPIPYREMRRIRTRHRKGEKKRYVSRFTQGQQVRITKGPFEGFDAMFDGTAGQRVKVMLSIFGRQTTIDLDEKDLVEAAA